MATVKPIPDGFHAVTPHLVVHDARAAMTFYRQAFDAEELSVLPMPDGRVGHAEIRIGGSVVMLADEFPEYDGTRSPHALGGTTSVIHLYVVDVDAAWEKAIAAGAQAIMPPTDMFWGDRYGKLRDPFGHEWSLATHISDPTAAEIEAGMAAMCGGEST